MSQKKFKPPISAKERKRLDSVDSLSPSSLPPELNGVDISWDDDAHSISELGLRPDSDLELDLDAGERTTAIPIIPMADIVAASMAEAEKKERLSHSGSQSPTVPSGPRPDSEPAETDTSKLSVRPDRPSSNPPLSTRSMAGPVGPPWSPKPGAGVDDRFSLAPPTTRAENDVVRQHLKDLYATGDFSGALELAETLLAADPGDLEAQRFSTSCRDVLTQMLQSRIGQLDQVVNVALSPEEMRWLTLDHRAGFLLSLVDGTISIEELLDITGMAKLESLRILVSLVEQHVIRLVPRSSL